MPAYLESAACDEPATDEFGLMKLTLNDDAD